MHQSSFHELKELALAKRQAGKMTFELREMETLAKPRKIVPDEFVSSYGFKSLGKAWRWVDRLEALRSLHRVLHADLAYQHPMMEQKTACFIAEGFISLFSHFSATFCTNGSVDERGLLSWSPITDASFDHGIVAFDEKHIGIIWVEDED